MAAPYNRKPLHWSAGMTGDVTGIIYLLKLFPPSSTMRSRRAPGAFERERLPAAAQCIFLVCPHIQVRFTHCTHAHVRGCSAFASGRPRTDAYVLSRAAFCVQIGPPGTCVCHRMPSARKHARDTVNGVQAPSPARLCTQHTRAEWWLQVYLRDRTHRSFHLSFHWWHPLSWRV